MKLKFKKGDKVKAVSGFHKGFKGTVVDYYVNKGIHENIVFYSVHRPWWTLWDSQLIKEDELELQ
jgi:ribosomal protein L24